MVLSENELGDLRGLSGRDVEERLGRYGYNELPSSKKSGKLDLIFTW